MPAELIEVLLRQADLVFVAALADGRLTVDQTLRGDPDAEAVDLDGVLPPEIHRCVVVSHGDDWILFPLASRYGRDVLIGAVAAQNWPHEAVTLDELRVLVRRNPYQPQSLH